MTTAEPPRPVPDEKDWTWTLERACPECGFDAAGFGRDEIPARIRDVMRRLAATLGRPNATTRPSPTTWSALEYVCHVRDVCTVFAERVQLMRDQDEPRFANWDQDETALVERYWAQPAAAVSGQARAAAERAASAFAALRPDEWTRPGVRSNGSRFTIESLGRYFLHDLYHHAHDVNADETPAEESA